jgi:hypothetical protein
MRFFVVQIRHRSPGGLPLVRFLVFGSGDIRCALLKLHRLTTCLGGHINQLLCDVNIPVVVNTDFSNHVTRVSRSDLVSCQGHCVHSLLLSVFEDEVG